MLVVVDINGVLGQVTKGRVPKTGTCARLPSGQKFYMNPEAPEFLDTLRRAGIPLVMWTSRLRKNAEPIEELPEFASRARYFMDMMHGEDCARVCGDFHPHKRASILRRRLAGQIDNVRLYFVDDSPDYIELDGKSEVVKCPTYEAGGPSSLKEIAAMLQQMNHHI